MTEESSDAKADVLTRLRRVEGQVRGIQRMVEEDRDCEVIVIQLMAARAALDKVSLIILSNNIEQCLLDRERQADPERLRRIVEFLIRLSPASTEVN